MISEENQNEEIEIELDQEEVEEEYAPELEEEIEIEEEEEVKEKPKLTLEQKRGILKRQLTKIEKELGQEPKKTAKQTKATEIDLGHLAFHNSKSNSVKIEHDEDIEYLKETMNRTGSTQSELLNDDYFQGKLKQRQEARVAKSAIPSNTKRSSTTTQNEVQYWINKGQMPPADQVELRRAVLNERLKREGDGSKFYNS